MPETPNAQREAVKLLIANKKKESNKQEVADFTKAWVDFASETGITEESISLLIDGFSIAGAAPLFELIRGAEGATPLVELRKLKVIQENNLGATLRICLHLLALYLNEGTNEKAITSLLGSTSRYECNREGKRFGSADQAVGKYFLRELKTPVSAAVFEIDVPESSAVKFLTVVRPAIAVVKAKKGAPKPELAAVDFLEAWLGDLSASVAPEPAEQPTLEGEKEGMGGDAQTGDASASQELCFSGEPSFDDVIGWLKRMKRNCENLEGKTDLLRSQVCSLESAAVRNSERIKSLEETILRQERLLDSRAQTISDLSAELDSAKSDISRMEDEIRSRDKMIDMLDSDMSRKSDELLARITKKLKLEYDDYLDAVDLPMDVDLGENMRGQLESVFKILRDSGMRL